MEKKCIGIDVGGTTVKIGIFETDGTLVYKWEVPSRKEENGNGRSILFIRLLIIWSRMGIWRMWLFCRSLRLISQLVF